MENTPEIQFNYTVLDLCIAGIFTLLIVATLFCRWLLKKNPGNTTLQKAMVIIKSWWYIATPTLICFMIGARALLFLFLAVTCYATVEIIKHSRRFASIRRPLTVLCVAGAALQYLTILMGWKILFFSLTPLLFIWVIPALIIFRAEIENFPQIIAAVMGTMMVSYYLSYIPALPLLAREIWPSQERALVAILILVFATELNDVMQFLAGKAFGRRKIFPVVSPNKTEAGFVGGLCGTTALFAILGPTLLDITLPQSLILGPLISLTGIFGDLLFSSLKRYYGVKDFSDLIPGHGGLMDRLDSLVLTAPLYFHLLYYFKGALL